MNKHEDIEVIDYNTFNIIDLQEILEEKYTCLFSKDKRSKEFKELKIEYNDIAKIYNKKINDKIYTIIK